MNRYGGDTEDKMSYLEEFMVVFEGTEIERMYDWLQTLDGIHWRVARAYSLD